MTKSTNTPEIIVTESGKGTLAFLQGRIDIDSSPAVRHRLLVLLQHPEATSVILDLSAVTHMDSSGIATLIEGLRLARVSKVELKLQGLHGRLLHLFQSTGLLALFTKSTPATLAPAQEA